MRPRLWGLIATVLLFQSVFSLSAQSTESDLSLNEILDAALSLAEEGEWDQALLLLDEAEEIDPNDERIESYRKSFLELQALDEAQKSWVEGTPAEVKPKDSESEEESEDEDTPKFVLDRTALEARLKPAATRDKIRWNTGVTFFAVNPIDSHSYNTWTSAEEFFYASLTTDFRYWFPFLGRSFGVNLQSNGYSWLPGNPQIFFNTIDAGVNIRGFLLESETSRMELGIDFGVASNSTKSDSGLSHTGAVYLGLWASDPVFYHLFDAESFEDFILGGELRIYSRFGEAEELLDMLNYRLDGAWRLSWGQLGVRLERWDFSTGDAWRNTLSFALFGGVHF